jgi:2-methylcitrate dehydratase PrpD
MEASAFRGPEGRMITCTLSEFVAKTRTDEIPDAVFGAARDALIDTLGVALAGTCEPAADIAARWVEENGGRARAAIWGRAVRASAAEAAFANGISSHALDFDDSHPSARGHAARLRRDGITARLSCSFNFLATRGLGRVKNALTER